ncbi:MAG TPA: GGDEF domain-containing protein [Devosiaceae bacterium]
MKLPSLDTSPRGWLRVALWTVLGTIACILATLAYDSYSFMQMAPVDRMRSVTNDILIPIILAPPLLFFFSSKIRELAIAKHELTRLATTDSLTACLNRGAFTALVDAYLEQVNQPMERRSGALLVIDADHFKAINDNFGHDKGDEALRIISNAIRDIVRGGDVIGRLGGEEFGVFLPGCGIEAAEAVANRIRSTITEAEFTPDGAPKVLTVSVGGAVFAQHIEFSELFRLADQQLYRAKEMGRNRVALLNMDAPESGGYYTPTLH